MAWTVVKSRCEPSEKYANPSEGEKVPLQTGHSSNQLHSHQAKESNDFTSLVGAPIKLVSVPKQSVSAASVTTSDSLREKIGQGFFLRTGGSLESPSPVFVKASQSRTDLDLRDAGEWPSMGGAGVPTSQLPSWSNAVKNPPPPVVKHSKNQVRGSVSYMIWPNN